MAAQRVGGLQKAWNRYAEDDQLDMRLVRPEVARSWQRCRKLTLSPFRAPDSYIDQAILKERLYRRERLVRVALPFMHDLYAFVRDSGFLVLLTDEFGLTLQVLGESTPVDLQTRARLIPGTDWGEGVRGTNAVGTALVERKPVQIYAWEHYCQLHHSITCSACPIFDPAGELIGVLDVTGDYRLANHHTLGMVVAAAHAIQNELQLEARNDQLSLAYQYTSLLLESMSDSLLSTDSDGLVTAMNCRAGKLLGVDPNSARGLHVEKLCDLGRTIIPVLQSGVEQRNRQVVIGNTGRKVTCSVAALRAPGGNVIGTVALFRDSASVPSRPQLRPSPVTFNDIVGESPVIKQLKEWAAVVAASPSTVLITGETGTGKELVARAIHSGSPRREEPFIAINCAALPENLVESELFGYEDGAFTGGKRGGRAGTFELADGGTIFLDEIGDMPVAVQMKLLRVLQERTTVRLGSVEERHINVRIIAATHKDLSVECKRGTFREDLYYRLAVLEVMLPPLRHRREDIPLVTRHIIREKLLELAREGHAHFVDLTQPPSLHVQDDFLEKLQAYSWPGNFRELENVIERAIIRMGDDRELHAGLLDFSGRPPSLLSPAAACVTPLCETEKKSVAEALATFQGNITQTSAHLGITRNTLYRKIKEYGLSFRTPQS